MTSEPSSRAELAEAVETFIAAYRAKYLCGKGVRSNAPLRREVGELRIAMDRASALTAPLSADREAVADLLALHVRNINRVIASGLHERDAIYEATDAILALTGPRGAGEDHVADVGNMVAGSSYATRPQPSSKSELQEPCDLEVSVNPQGDTSDEYQWPLPNDVPTYEDALRLVLHFQKPSTSFVQRKLQLGYNRAASFIERMEAEGVCTRSNYAGKREMLHPPATSDLSDHAMKREDRTAHDDPKPVLPANAKGMKP